MTPAPDTLPPSSPLAGFHPAVGEWFARTLGAPTDCQSEAWPAIRSGRNALIAAPTGSGKTLAAFLGAIDELVREGLERPLPDETRVLYVSPLKALSNDIQRNLERPLMGISDCAQRTRAARRSASAPWCAPATPRGRPRGHAAHAAAHPGHHAGVAVHPAHQRRRAAHAVHGAHR